ncbi:MAG: PAS domain S-box protein, partial [Syntrophobacteraceae bacterium]
MLDESKSKEQLVAELNELRLQIAQLGQERASFRESEQNYRQLAETINEVFWIANVDASEIIYVSPAYERIWGKTCEVIVQVHPANLDFSRAFTG